MWFRHVSAASINAKAVMQLARCFQAEREREAPPTERKNETTRQKIKIHEETT